MGYDGLWFMNKETLTDILRTLIYDVFLETFIGKEDFLNKKKNRRLFIFMKMMSIFF